MPPQDGAPDAFKLPFAGDGQTWDVTNGYGQYTHASGDELYALDLGKVGSSLAAGRPVFAPVGLTVLSTGFACAKAGEQGEGIIAQMDGRPFGVQPDGKRVYHFLKICHFQKAPYKKHYKQGEPFVTDADGKVPAVAFSQGTNSHIHMNVFSADYPNFDNNRQPIPFDKEYALEGVSYPAIPPAPAKPMISYECTKDQTGKRTGGACDLRSSQGKPATPPPSGGKQLRLSAPAFVGWWATIKSCGDGTAPVRLDGQTIMERTPGSTFLHVSGGDHLVEWSGSAITVDYAWWPASPSPCPPAVPDAAALLKDSTAAMRDLAKLDARAGGDAFFFSGKGQVTLALPDTVQGQWEGLGHSIDLVPGPGGTTFVLDDRQRGTIAGKGGAAAVRDGLLSVPGYASEWKVRQVSGGYLLEGALPADAMAAVSRMISVDFPGRPSGQLALTIDGRSKLWQRLELKLRWADWRIDLFGHDLDLSPGASAWLSF